MTETIWTCPNEDCENHLMVFDHDPQTNYCLNCGTKLETAILDDNDEEPTVD